MVYHMVNSAAQLDDVFAALSDATRRAMVARLAKGAVTVGELGAPFDMTKGAVSKHVKVLERAGLLTRDVQGRVHRCEIDTRPLDRAQKWVDGVRAHWEQQFDELSDYLDELQGKTTKKRKKR